MQKANEDKLWSIILWSIFAGIMSLLWLHSHYRWFSHDEFEHIHTSWKMLQGQRIYVDFFQHHHPFLSYMLVPVISIFGETTASIFAARNLIFIILCAILAVTYLIALRIFGNREIGVISIILTSSFAAFYGEAIEVRPDVPQALAGLLSIYYLFVYYEKRSRWSLALSAIFLAVSFLFLQKAIALIVAMGFLFLYDLYVKRLSIKDALLFAGVFILTLLPYYTYLLLSGALEQYFVMNWTLNIHIRQTQGYSKYYLLVEILRENIITCMLFLMGLVMLLRSGKARQLAILSLLLIVTVLLLYKNLWKQYFMFIVPLAGVIAGYALYSVFQTRVSRLIVILFAIYMPLGLMHDFSSVIQNRSFETEWQSEQLDKINYVLSLTEENDKIYDGNIKINLFRDDIDYFWFCVAPDDCLDVYRNIAGYEYDIYELISEHKPKVVNTFAIDNLDDPRIKKHYRKSDRYDDVLIRVD